jgi:hypothetical protein
VLQEVVRGFPNVSFFFFYYRFGKLVGDEVVRGVESINDERCKVTMEHVITTLDELKVNPFAFRLCQLFAQNGDFLLFEEFLDMMSVLSEAAPPQVTHCATFD